MNLSIQEKTIHINRVHQEPGKPIGEQPLPPMNLEEFIELMEKTEWPTLKFMIKEDSWDLIKAGQLDIITRSRNRYYDVRLKNSIGGHLEYMFVELQSKHRKMTLEYCSYFISNSNHFIKYNAQDRIKVSKGDYVIKLGKIIKVSE